MACKLHFNKALKVKEIIKTVRVKSHYKGFLHYKFHFALCRMHLVVPSLGNNIGVSFSSKNT